MREFDGKSALPSQMGLTWAAGGGEGMESWEGG